jgi:hypothetical protein
VPCLRPNKTSFCTSANSTLKANFSSCSNCESVFASRDS